VQIRWRACAIELTLMLEIKRQRIPLSDFNQSIFLIKEPRNLIDEDLPVITLWPNIPIKSGDYLYFL